MPTSHCSQSCSLQLSLPRGASCRVLCPHPPVNASFNFSLVCWKMGYSTIIILTPPFSLILVQLLLDSRNESHASAPPTYFGLLNNLAASLLTCSLENPAIKFVTDHLDKGLSPSICKRSSVGPGALAVVELCHIAQWRYLYLATRSLWADGCSSGSLTTYSILPHLLNSLQDFLIFAESQGSTSKARDEVDSTPRLC